MASGAIEQRNQEATAYVGNLDEQVTEELLWELMIQVGPVVNVHMPKDKVTSRLQGYGFIEFRSEDDADYAIKVMNMVKLFGKPLRVNKSSQNKQSLDIGANLFIGGLHPDVDEKLLYDTFSAFGGIIFAPKIMREDAGGSKGFGFVQYDSFESSDMAIECMNGQYLLNQPIVVQYAYKKESRGERHGSDAERLLAAANARKAGALKPHTMFASAPGQPGAAPPSADASAMMPPMMPAPPMGMPSFGGMPGWGAPPGLGGGFGSMSYGGMLGGGGPMPGMPGMPGMMGAGGMFPPPQPPRPFGFPGMPGMSGPMGGMLGMGMGGMGGPMGGMGGPMGGGMMLPGMGGVPGMGPPPMMGMPPPPRPPMM